MIRRLSRAFVTASCVLLGVVATASASTATVSQSVGVTAGAGEQNEIVVSSTGSSATITDTAGITSSSLGCTPDGSGNRIDCVTSGPLLSVQVLAGDRDDKVTLILPAGTVQFGSQVSGGDGNDTLDGSQVVGGLQNAFSGFAGNDTLIGGPVPSIFDNGPAGDPSAGPGVAPDQILKLVSAGDDRLVSGPANDALGIMAGSDTADAGDGDDNINSIPVSSQNKPEDDNAPDSVICGGGNDTATLGQGDSAGADCELIGQFTTCPPGGPDCEGTATITVPAGASGSAAVAAGGKGKGKKKVLGKSRKTKVKAGQSKGVTIKLKSGKVNSALKKRDSVSATIDLGLDKVKGGKTVGRVKRKVRFKLKK